MEGLPPGIQFIIANAPRILLPPVLTFSAIRLCNLFFHLYTPDWLYIPLTLASLPFAFACNSAYADLRNKQQAALHGASLAPSVPIKWPGGLDLLIPILRNVREGYMGEVFEQMCRAYGNTITLDVLWERKIFTIEPEHIKAIVATQFNSFAKGKIFHDILYSLLGTGIFNSDGDTWRTSTEHVVLPAVKGEKPIYVPPNTRIPHSVFLMHRRKDLWGPDAEEFDPDRFLDERLHKYLSPNPIIFQPFSIGPRNCLGQQFAYNEMSYFLVRLLQAFSAISLAEDVQTLPPAEWALGPGRKAVEKAIIRSHLTTYIQDGLWVRMEEAHNAGDGIA